MQNKYNESGEIIKYNIASFCVCVVIVFAVIG